MDDLDTAFRHLDLYDRFGCPGGHVQAAFRCLTRFGGQIDDKVPRSLDVRIHACWINPGAQPQTAAAAAPATSGSAAPAASPAPAACPRLPPHRHRARRLRRNNRTARNRNIRLRSSASKVRALKTPSRHSSCEIARQDYLSAAAVSVEPRGQVRFRQSRPVRSVAMRAIVAVLLFVTAAHAALWGLFQEKQQAPDFRGILPSASYAPFEPGHHGQSTSPPIPKRFAPT